VREYHTKIKCGQHADKIVCWTHEIMCAPGENPDTHFSVCTTRVIFYSVSIVAQEPERKRLLFSGGVRWLSRSAFNSLLDIDEMFLGESWQLVANCNDQGLLALKISKKM